MLTFNGKVVDKEVCMELYTNISRELETFKELCSTEVLKVDANVMSGMTFSLNNIMETLMQLCTCISTYNSIENYEFHDLDYEDCLKIIDKYDPSIFSTFESITSMYSTHSVGRFMNIYKKLDEMLDYLKELI